MLTKIIIAVMACGIGGGLLYEIGHPPGASMNPDSNVYASVPSISIPGAAPKVARQ